MSIKDTRIYQFIRKNYYTLKNWDEIQDKKGIKKVIEVYKNIHDGEDCVIIGNGPSLRVQDLDKLYQLHIPTFACNRVTLVFDQTKWRPTYYFISDEKILEGYTDHVDGVPENHRFFPKTFRDKGLHGVFYGGGPEAHDYTKEGMFSLDASDGVYGGGSVTTEMLQFAYYMGFRNIYLIGVDFSYAVNNPLNNQTYAYQGEQNYFIKGYLKPGEIAAIPNVQANLLAFHAAKEAAEANGFSIKNATRGGKLEVFERVDLDALFVDWGKKENGFDNSSGI